MFGCLEAVWLKSWIKRTEVMGAKRSLEDCRRGNSMIFQWCATESSQCLIIPRSEFDQTPKKLPRSSAKMFVSEECPNHKLFHVTLQLFVSVNASYHNDIMSRMMESRCFFFCGHVFVIEIPSSLFGILMILVRRELLPRNGPSTMLTRGSRCGNMFWFVMICHAPPVTFKERLKIDLDSFYHSSTSEMQLSRALYLSAITALCNYSTMFN